MELSQQDIRELVTKLNTGSSSAFKEIYKIYYKGLLAFACQYVGQDEAEDIVQEVMLWIWENRTMISAKFSLKSLLFTSVKNKALNAIAHQKVKRVAFTHLIKEYDEDIHPDDYLKGEIFTQYKELLNSLPENYREAFELNRIKQLTHKEIAEKLNVSPQTINYRISQALKLLRSGLSKFTYLSIAAFLAYLFISIR